MDPATPTHRATPWRFVRSLGPRVRSAPEPPTRTRPSNHQPLNSSRTPVDRLQPRRLSWGHTRKLLTDGPPHTTRKQHSPVVFTVCALRDPIGQLPARR